MSDNITLPKDSVLKLMEVIGLYGALMLEVNSFKIDPEPIMDKIEKLLVESKRLSQTRTT